MLKRVILATLFCTLFISGSHASNGKQEHIKQIQEVVEAFKVSIIKKDKKTFKSLFYSNDIPFIAVFSDEMVERKRKDNPNFPRSVNFGQFGSPIEDMIEDDVEQEEKIWNVKIDTDGYLGSVHFDYSDHVDGYKRAWGTESWDLIKEDSGWKIVSVTFTVTENTEPKKK